MTTTFDAPPADTETRPPAPDLEELDESDFDIDADPRLGDILTEADAPMFCTWKVGY